MKFQACVTHVIVTKIVKLPTLDTKFPIIQTLKELYKTGKFK